MKLIFNEFNFISSLCILCVLFGLFLLIRRKPLIRHYCWDLTIFLIFLIYAIINVVVKAWSVQQFSFSDVLYNFMLYSGLTMTFFVLRPFTYHVSGINSEDFKKVFNKTLDSLILQREDYGNRIYIDKPEIDIIYEARSGEVNIKLKYKKNDSEFVKKFIDRLSENIMDDKVKFKYASSIFNLSFGIGFLGIMYLLRFVLK